MDGGGGGARRLVLVSNRRLDDVRSGSGAYLRTFLEAARAEGFTITLLMAPSTAFGSRPFARVAPEIAALAAPVWPWSVKAGGGYVSAAPEVWGRFVRRLGIEAARRLRLDLGPLTRTESLLSRVPAERELKALADAVRRREPACVVVEYSSLGPLLARVPETPGRGVLMHDLFASRAASFHAAGKPLDHADVTLEAEAGRLQGANFILHASMNEQARLAPLLPHARHVWMRPTTRARRDALRERPPAAVFMGADHAGNREALEHLLTEIWPRVRRAAPEARLEIAGGVGERLKQRPPGVTTLGPLADLTPIAGPDRIGLAPIRVSSGVAIKLADYMGLGLPVIAYPGGLDGFAGALDAAAVRVETEEEFAEALVHLLTSESARRARSEAGLRLAETLLSDSGIGAALGAYR